MSECCGRTVVTSLFAQLSKSTRGGKTGMKVRRSASAAINESSPGSACPGQANIKHIRLIRQMVSWRPQPRPRQSKISPTRAAHRKLRRLPSTACTEAGSTCLPRNKHSLSVVMSWHRCTNARRPTIFARILRQCTDPWPSVANNTSNQMARKGILAFRRKYGLT